MARFHCSEQAAQQLQVHTCNSVPDVALKGTFGSSWTDLPELSEPPGLSVLDFGYMSQSTAAAQSTPLAVKQCHVSSAVACPKQLALLLALMQALPALQGMAVQLDAPCSCCIASDHAAMLIAQAGCKGLHTLALGLKFEQLMPHVLAAASPAMQLHSLRWTGMWLQRGPTQRSAPLRLLVY